MTLLPCLMTQEPLTVGNWTQISQISIQTGMNTARDPKATTCPLNRLPPAFSRNCHGKLLPQTGHGSPYCSNYKGNRCSSVQCWPCNFVRQCSSWDQNMFPFSFPHLRELWSVLEKLINNLRGNFKFRCYPHWGEQN